MMSDTATHYIYTQRVCSWSSCPVSVQTAVGTVTTWLCLFPQSRYWNRTPGSKSIPFGCKYMWSCHSSHIPIMREAVSRILDTRHTLLSVYWSARYTYGITHWITNSSFRSIDHTMQLQFHIHYQWWVIIARFHIGIHKRAHTVLLRMLFRRKSCWNW
jgi:hypothetical protein